MVRARARDPPCPSPVVGRQSADGARVHTPFGKEWPGRNAAPGLLSLNTRSAPPQKNTGNQTRTSALNTSAHTPSVSLTHSSVVRTQLGGFGSTSRVSVHLSSRVSNCIATKGPSRVLRPFTPRLTTAPLRSLLWRR